MLNRPPDDPPDRWTRYTKLDWLLGIIAGIVAWALLAFVSPWH